MEGINPNVLQAALQDFEIDFNLEMDNGWFPEALLDMIKDKGWLVVKDPRLPK